MFKRNWLRTAALTAIVICVLLLAACGGPAKENKEQTPPQTNVETENDQPAPVSPVTDPDPQPPVTPPESSGNETESKPPVAPPEVKSDPVAKINGGADEVGIYSIVVRLTNQAADKGTVEMVYYGAKGSPQENSIVNTFRIEYYKESSGTYEISTFFNGDVYQNQHHKEEVKVTNTFDATLRAGNVIITYTPDGGAAQEIFRADADYFRASK